MDNPQQEAVGQVVRDRLERVVVGEGLHHDRMTVFPLFEPNGRPTEGEGLDYRTLDEAITEGWVVVSEKPAATVPELVLSNQGKAMVLVLDGEEIVGGRQNRMVNTTFLVAAGTEVALPVSCVEHGRWHEVSDRFQPGEVSYFSLKREKFDQVKAHLRHSGRPTADQSAIWSSLNERHTADRSHSGTEAMNDLYRIHDQALADYERAFPYRPDAIGLAVALNGHLAGAELFDQPRTAAVLWRKLVRSYAMDALEGKQGAPVGPDRAKRFLSRFQNARGEVFSSLALGDDVRLEGEGAVGLALVYRDIPVHLSLFRRLRNASAQGHLVRASTRRRFQSGMTT